MTIAMHRVEGFIAPRNQNGNTPPVLAHITSNRDLWNPEVMQVYATGTAAERLAGDYKSNNSECGSCDAEPGTALEAPYDQQQEAAEKPRNRSSPVVFSTSTTVGLRIGLTTENIIDGVVLGYRRKEMSFVPSLVKDNKGNYRYPSLIAAIHLNSSAGNKAGFNSCQGFATGSAATALAASDDSGGLGCIHGSFKTLLTSQKSAQLRQHAEVARLVTCYVSLSDDIRKRGVRENAAKFGLPAPAPLVRVTDDGLKKAVVPIDEDSVYVMQLLNAIVPDNLDPDLAPTNAAQALLREHQFRAHREVVCAAAAEAEAQAQ
jgi:hypothetical protein